MADRHRLRHEPHKEAAGIGIGPHRARRLRHRGWAGVPAHLFGLGGPLVAFVGTNIGAGGTRGVKSVAGCTFPHPRRRLTIVKESPAQRLPISLTWSGVIAGPTYPLSPARVRRLTRRGSRDPTSLCPAGPRTTRRRRRCSVIFTPEPSRSPDERSTGCNRGVGCRRTRRLADAKGIGRNPNRARYTRGSLGRRARPRRRARHALRASEAAAPTKRRRHAWKLFAAKLQPIKHR